MEFGFSNDQARFDAVVAWRDAAIADGWSVEPYFPNHEPVSSASKLRREGYIASILTREKVNSKWKFECQMSVWGPDGLAIKVPVVYDWQKISTSQRRCNYCKAEDVETHQVGFAGRACAACLPAQRKRQEYPGWTR